jgi:GPH family glycoside/pentoside/hexuronide:cation symporter
MSAAVISQPLVRKPVPLGLKILYGVGEIPITLTMAVFGIYVLLFYNSVMGLNGALAGFGVTAGLVVDAVLDPYIGFRSDAARFALGRRQSFMLFGCLGMGPFFWALMSPPQGLSTPVLFTWLLISSLGFRFCFATYRIPYLSLGAELTTDYDERTRVIAVRSLVGLIGMAAGATLPLLIFFRKLDDGLDQKLHYAGYPRMGAAFGLTMTAAGLISVFGTQSSKTFGAIDAAREEARRFFAGMWLFLKNRDFRTLWFSFTLGSLAVVVNFSLGVHFLKWYAGIEDHRWLSLVQGSFYAGAVVGVAGWIWVAKRGEKRNFYAASVLGLVTILVLASLLIGKDHLFGMDHPIPLMAGNLIAGLFASALWVLPFSMMADVVDEDELKSGMRREGVCFGMMNFGEKIASGGALLISGTLLSHFIHLAPGDQAQGPDVAARIGISYGMVPGILLALAIALILRFSLNRKKVADIQARLYLAQKQR